MQIEHTACLIANNSGGTGVGTGSFSKSGTISPEIKSSSNSSIEKKFSPDRLKIHGVLDFRDTSPQKSGNFTQRESTIKKISPKFFGNAETSNFLL